MFKRDNSFEEKNTMKDPGSFLVKKIIIANFIKSAKDK
jgi:hypothetical protein